MSVIDEMFVVGDSSIHGKGAFAVRSIPVATRIAEYRGEKISKAESAKRCEEQNDYIFYLDETFDLDGNIPGNRARFLNHSCEPNCVVEKIDGRLWIVAARDIPSGEELTFDYGYDLEFFRDYPCRCGAAKCCGYVLAEELRKGKNGN